MKQYNPIFYLLFILLVMGTFASMAQNSYGLTMIGGVAFVFGLVFIIEIISLWRKKEQKISAFIEPVCLLIISVILGLRVFYIYFSNIEWVFGAATLVLIVFYFFKMVTRFRYYQNKNRFLAVLVILFHVSIIFFLASLAIELFAPYVAEVAGSLAIVFLLCFVAAGLLRKQVLVEGDNLSALGMVKSFKGHSIMLATLVLLFSLYFGLNRAGLLPAIYSDEYPQAYFGLVNQAATGEEKPINGEYKYEEFMKNYKQFLKDNGGNNQ